MQSTKATGLEVKKFLKDMEEAHGRIDILFERSSPELEVDGRFPTSIEELKSIDDLSIVKVCGFIALGNDLHKSLSRIFRDWRKGQSSVSKIVMVPSDKIEEFNRLAKEIGCLVLNHS